jgi:hypothetical protein
MTSSGAAEYNIGVPATFRTWFGEQIFDHDLTVTAIAHALDQFDGTVEDWLAGRALPDDADCRKLAQLFEANHEFVRDLARRSRGHADR